MQMEIGAGSPVDMARSYMKERPPWASPTEHVELRTPLTTTMKLFKERTPYSVTEDILSSSQVQFWIFFLGVSIYFVSMPSASDLAL